MGNAADTTMPQTQKLGSKNLEKSQDIAFVHMQKPSLVEIKQ
jgi:hypothetical protein